MQPRVDLADPSDDARALAAALERAGFAVRSSSLASVPETDADVLVLAGDAAGALDALRTLRDDGPRPDTPVVLVGVPAGTSHRGGSAGFGAEMVLLRPVDPLALVRAVRDLQIAPPITHSRPSGRPEPTPERTLQLSRSQDDELPSTGTDPLRDVERIPSEPPARRELTPATRSEPGFASTPAIISVPKQTAPISDALRALLAAADRRVFPTRSPLDIWLPGGDQSAEELLPAEVLHPLEIDLDEPDEEALEGFTLVGVPEIAHGTRPRESSAVGSRAGSSAGASSPGSIAPDESAVENEAEGEGPSTSPGTPTSLSRRPPAPSAPPPPPPRTGTSGSTRPGVRKDAPEPGINVTGVQEARVRPSALPEAPPARLWPDEDPALGRVGADGSFRGKASDGGILRILLRLASLGIDAELEIYPEGASTIELALRDGYVSAMRGPIASRAYAKLLERGALPGEAPASELDAERALERAVTAGSMGELGRARALREAREALLGVAIGSSGSWVVRPPAPSDDDGRALGPPLAALAVEAARRGLGRARVREMLGTVALRPGPRLEALAASAQLEPELATWASSLGATPLDVALAQLADEPGAAGLVFALVAGDALVVAPLPEQASAPDPTAARALVEQAHALALEGDYFRVLGVTREAGDRDIARAHRDSRARLEALHLDELGLGDLEAARSLALEIVDEAAEALRVERLREAYRRALDASSADRGAARGPHLATGAREH